MALPIASTPTLYGKEARAFEARVKAGLGSPLKITTPRV